MKKLVRVLPILVAACVIGGSANTPQSSSNPDVSSYYTVTFVSEGHSSNSHFLTLSINAMFPP